MRVLVLLLSSALALTSGSYAPPYVGPIHLPVIGANGVPIEPHEVLAARANHLATHAAIKSTGGSGYGPSSHLVPAASSIPAVPPGAPWPGPFAEVAPDGTPLDTPEVRAAKVRHLTDYNEAARRSAVGHFTVPGVHGHWRRRRSIGVFPLAYHTSQAFPVIGHDGQPVETPEVQDAKSRHFATLHREAARNSLGGPDIGSYSYGAQQFTAPYAFGAPYSQAPYSQASFSHGAYSQSPYSQSPYSHGYHVPVIGPGGVPIEPPEVQHARALHFDAHAKARSKW